MGISAQQILGENPEYLQRQLAQQRIQGYMAPFSSQQERTAGLLGGLLGGGIANIFNNRGFFDVTDPALQRVTEVNKIITEGLKDIDPTDKEKMGKAYSAIAKQLAAAGYAQPAALAAAEATKFIVTPKYSDVSALTGITKGGKRVALFFDQTSGSYKYRDSKGQLKDWTGDVDYRPVPESRDAAIARMAGEGAGKKGEKTDQDIAREEAAKRKAAKKAQIDAATKDPLAEKWDDSPEVRAEKKRQRQARDAERAKAASESTDWTVAP